MLASRFAVLCVVCSIAPSARAEPPRTAFVWWGEPDPTGADEAFLSLARRRGAPAVRETPGQLGAERPSTRLQHAVATYQALKLDAAVAELDALEREVAATGGGGLGQGELVDLHAYRAAARLALGGEAAAWDDLLAVARLAPGRPLDPARFAPRLIEAARRAAQAVGAPVTLRISVQPASALVILDGRLIGRGQVEASVVPGPHLVRAERSGFRADGRVVEVLPTGSETRLSLPLETAPPAATLLVRSAPAGSTGLLTAFIAQRGGEPVVTLDLWNARSGSRLGHTEVPDTEGITSAALAAAVDGLLVSVEPGPSGPARRPWWRSGLVWGLAGGLTAAALGVGLGVGLGMSQSSGTSARLDLGAAR